MQNILNKEKIKEQSCALPKICTWNDNTATYETEQLELLSIIYHSHKNKFSCKFIDVKISLHFFITIAGRNLIHILPFLILQAQIMFYLK